MPYVPSAQTRVPNTQLVATRRPDFRPHLAYQLLITSFITLLVLLAGAHPSYAQSLSSITVLPTGVIGGASATGTITLTGKAPRAGISVAVTSSNTSTATVPATVVVPAGQTSKTFGIKTVPVSGIQGVTITGSYGGVTQTANLTVDEAAVTSVTVVPTNLVGGATATGTVALSGKAPSGGISVTVGSSDPSTMVPSQVVVPAGKSSQTFKVTTQGVATSTSVTITATFGATATTLLTVTPAALATVSVVPTTVTGGVSAVGKITLTGESASGGASVTVTSSDTTLATVKSPVVVPAHMSTAAFTVVAKSVTTNSSVTLTATYNGVPATTTLNITPSILQSVSVLPGRAAGGAPVTGTITLTKPAPSGGITITTKSSNTVLAQATSPVTISAGTTSATFAISTSGSSVSTPVTISATYAGTTVKTTLTVAPAYTNGFGQGYVTGPQGIAIDPVTQDIYVACWNSNGGSVVKFDKYYDYLFTFGTTQLQSACSVAIDFNGNVYVGDYFKSTCFEFDANGNYLMSFDGQSSGVTMDLVTGVAVDSLGNVYVLDDVNARVVVFTPYGDVASQFHVDGNSVDIALDGNGNLWVAEYASSVLGEWSLGGTREAIAGLGNFETPYGLCIDPNGYIWATDIASKLVEEYTGTGGFVTSYQPPLSNASPTGIGFTRDGHVLVSDSTNNYVEIFVPNPPN